MAMHPTIKLGNAILKAIVRDGLTRIKREQPSSSPSKPRSRSVSMMP